MTIIRFVIHSDIHTPIVTGVNHCDTQIVMTDEKRTAVMMLRTKPSLKAAAERAAKNDGRSLSSLVEKLLSDHLRQSGVLPSGQ